MEREFVTAEQSLSAHGPVGLITALGGCAAAWFGLSGIPAVAIGALSIVLGGAIASQAKVHEIWIEGSGLYERTGRQVSVVPLGAVENIEHLFGLKVPPSVRISGQGSSVVITVEKHTEPLRRAVGQRMRQLNPGRMYSDVKAMRDLLM